MSSIGTAQTVIWMDAVAAGLTKISSLDFRYSCFRHLVAVGVHREQTEGFAGRGSASSPRPLVGSSLTNGCDNEGLHAASGVVAVLLHKARIYHKLQQQTTYT